MKSIFFKGCCWAGAGGVLVGISNEASYISMFVLFALLEEYV